MNKSSKKGAIGEGKSLEEGGLIQQYTEGGIQHIRANNTNTKDEGIDYVREINKNVYKKPYKKLKSDLKNGGKK